MGVSINAYVGLKKRADVIAGEDYAIDPETGDQLPHLWRAYVNPDFPGRADEIEHRAYYEYDRFVEGIDRSYGGYGLWRNELAKLAGWPQLTPDPVHGYAESAWKATSGPFWELINFADNEGVIGAKVCAKLAKDFAEYQEKANAHANPFFRECYDGMRRVFEAASDNGVVDYS